MTIKEKLKNEIAKLEPKTVFKLTNIYNDDDNKVAGKVLSELSGLNKSPESVNIYYIGKDNSNHKWYVKGFENK